MGLSLQNSYKSWTYSPQGHFSPLCLGLVQGLSCTIIIVNRIKTTKIPHVMNASHSALLSTHQNIFIWLKANSVASRPCWCAIPCSITSARALYWGSVPSFQYVSGMRLDTLMLFHVCSAAVHLGLRYDITSFRGFKSVESECDCWFALLGRCVR